MSELFCTAFLIGFLLFYALLFLAILGRAIGAALWGKKVRISRPAGRLRDFALSPENQN